MSRVIGFPTVVLIGQKTLRRLLNQLEVKPKPERLAQTELVFPCLALVSSKRFASGLVTLVSELVSFIMSV